MAIIFDSVRKLSEFASQKDELLIVTSGGFDPMHIGHLRCLRVSSDIARARGANHKVAVIVNDDGFLLRKKGYAFMPIAERLEIIAGIEGVDYVVPWDDGSQTVVGALQLMKNIAAFTKGGDRCSSENVPEFDVCFEKGATVIFNVGGGKIQSSSTLVAASRKHNENS